MIRRLTAFTLGCYATQEHGRRGDGRRGDGRASPLVAPLLATSAVLIAAGVVCANPVELLIGAICGVAALCQRATHG